MVRVLEQRGETSLVTTQPNSMNNSPGHYPAPTRGFLFPRLRGLQIWEHSGWSTTRNFPLNSSPGSVVRRGGGPPSANPPLAQASLPATFRSAPVGEATRLLGKGVGGSRELPAKEFRLRRPLTCRAGFS